MWPCRPVCVLPGRNPEDRFSCDETHIVMCPEDAEEIANSVDPDQ